MKSDGYDAAQLLSKVNINSFGTAEEGWPVGPQYEHANNTADPVPHAIAGAQKNFPEQTLSDNDATPTQRFTQPFMKPFDAHSLDDVYINKVNEAPGPRDCKC